MSSILIGIPTYKRPKMLKRLLVALEKTDIDAEVRVLVADNDAIGRDGLAVAEDVRMSGYRFPLESILVEQQGFSYSRNAILEFAFSDPSIDFVAMIDDDQWPEPDWLTEMLKMQRQTAADVVGAAVWPDFEIPPPRWAIESQAYALDTTSHGVVDVVLGNGGVLISKNFARLLPRPWYDHVFARSGGEDGDLFMRLRAVGGRFARTSAAIIHETIPASRLTLQWALARAYRTGNCEMRRVLLRSWSTGYFLKEGMKILAAFTLLPFAFLLFSWSPGRRVDTLCKLWRAAGKVAALQGSSYDEYATVHGR